MSKEKISEETLKNNISGEVLSAFLSIAPKVSMVSLVAFVTAIVAFNFFFNRLVLLDIIGAWVLALSLVVGLITLFKSVHLAVEDRLFRVLYQNPKDTKVFDEAVQFMWKKHKKGMSLQERWDGSYCNFTSTITLCITQWILTVAGFSALVIGVQPL